MVWYSHLFYSELNYCSFKGNDSFTLIFYIIFSFIFSFQKFNYDTWISLGVSCLSGASQVAPVVKNLPANAGNTDVDSIPG